MGVAVVYMLCHYAALSSDMAGIHDFLLRDEDDF
jgi:hypothetical protein